MSKPIAELVAPIIFDAVGIASLQRLLDLIDKPAARMAFVRSWLEEGHITADEADLLIEFNKLEAA